MVVTRGGCFEECSLEPSAFYLWPRGPSIPIPSICAILHSASNCLPASRDWSSPRVNTAIGHTTRRTMLTSADRKRRQDRTVTSSPSLRSLLRPSVGLCLIDLPRGAGRNHAQTKMPRQIGTLGWKMTDLLAYHDWMRCKDNDADDADDGYMSHVSTTPTRCAL